MLRPFSQPIHLFSACLALAAFAGCGEPSSDLDDSNSGGATMTGGSASGGAHLTGGATASGGALASGGSIATGGVADGGSGGEADGGTSTGGAAGGANGSGGASGGAVGSGGEGGDPSSGGSTGGESGAGGSSGGAPSACPTVPALTGGTEYCSNTKGTIPGSQLGFELWAEGSGSGCMRVHGSDGAFSATWTDVDDFLARTGLDFNQTQTHSQIGNIKAEFAATKEEEGGGFTYIGVYGWTVNPLREFYILEDWGSVMPGGFSSDGTPRDEVGTLVADGETYDVWKKTRVDKPAITGDSETFDQYFSIRRTARQCGTISVSDHFTQWEALGEPLGNLHEVKLLLESQYNSGSAQFPTARVYVE